MKHIFKSFITLLLLLSTACKQNFLQEEPYSFISAEALYKNNDGLKAAINGCYSRMAGEGGFSAGYGSLLNVASGGFRTFQDASADLDALTFGASTLWLSNNTPWDAFYSAINVANDIIEYAPKGDASDSMKIHTVGEAHLLRGMLYFNLVRMFGGVPLHAKPVSASEPHLPRAPKEEIYKLIIADLEKAKAMMAGPATAVKGRPHKFAAYALLGKVYLTLENWQKAKDELLALVNSNAYQLEKSSVLLFDINNENCKESIIEIQYSAAVVPPGGNWTNLYTPRSNFTPLAQNGPFGPNRLNKVIFDRHRAQYPTDPRIDAHYIYGQFMRGTTVVKVYPDNKAGEGFPYIKKYIDPGYINTPSNRNFIYLRYADVLLMLAEAENEINGPDNAYQWINQVLKRARDKNGDGSVIATTPADWSDMTQAMFRERILRERRYELIGECHLWYDTRRKGLTYTMDFLKEHNTHPALNPQFDRIYPLDPRLMLFPIPEREINTNSKIEPKDQNPGY